MWQIIKEKLKRKELFLFNFLHTNPSENDRGCHRIICPKTEMQWGDSCSKLTTNEQQQKKCAHTINCSFHAPQANRNLKQSSSQRFFFFFFFQLWRQLFWIFILYGLNKLNIKKNTKSIRCKLVGFLCFGFYCFVNQMMRIPVSAHRHTNDSISVTFEWCTIIMKVTYGLIANEIFNWKSAKDEK